MGHNFQSSNNQLITLDRLVFLIDGVFAIVLTLLVLDLKIPVENISDLPQALRELLPRLAIYLFAFATIANQWAIHYRTFRIVHHADSSLVTLSLINLLFITLIPVSAGIVGSHPSEPLAVACFSFVGLLLCLSACSVWAYVAVNHRLLAEDADPRMLSGIAKVWLFVGIGFGIALLVGGLSVLLAYAIWLIWSPIVSLWWSRERRRIHTFAVPQA